MRAEARARAIAGVLALLLAALVAATFDGADWPDAIPLPQRAGSTETPSAEDSGTQPTLSPGQGEPPEAADPATLPAWSRLVVRGLLLLLLAGAVIAILVSVRFVILRRRLRGDAALRADPPPLPVVEPEPDPDAVETALADTLAGLDRGTPRNAVVACWVRLEELAVAQGLPRHPSDTPAEFVTRALEAYRLDQAVLERLADLYREARFSEHALTEAHRAAAGSCLERLVQGVRRGRVAP